MKCPQCVDNGATSCSLRSPILCGFKLFLLTTKWLSLKHSARLSACPPGFDPWVSQETQTHPWGGQMATSLVCRVCGQGGSKVPCPQCVFVSSEHVGQPQPNSSDFRGGSKTHAPFREGRVWSPLKNTQTQMRWHPGGPLSPSQRQVTRTWTRPGGPGAFALQSPCGDIP